MYIYQLPFDINRELCRLLDNDDDWKELAGVYMKYSAFDINEMEQEARRHQTSPCNQLFTRWGQLNHRVEELFILLHRMKHVPAMRCLMPVVDVRFHRLLKRDSASSRNDTARIGDEINNLKQQNEGSESSLPLPVMLIEKGVQLATSSRDLNVNIHSDTSGTENSSELQSKGSSADTELFRKVAAIPMISYEDLTQATDNWSEDNLLGKGGFGQVFKGEWKVLPVAVKRLRDNDAENKELIRELCLNQYRHDNILPLYGYSLGGPSPCLVYQLMCGGSLEARLRGRTRHAPLSATQRHRIAHGVARGLQYLHTMSGTPLIHGDIKPANILLDQCSMPKIGDFGLARRGPYGEDRTHLKVSKVHGTRYYLPAEYLRSRWLSCAVDVFSFGVVVLELASGLPVADRARAPHALADYVAHLHHQGVDLATLEDRVLKGTPNSNPSMCREFISIGLQCTSESRLNRPTMLEVYRRLDSMQCVVKSEDYLIDI